MTEPTKRKRNNAVIALKMQALLIERPASYEELVAVSELARHSVEHWVRNMRRAGYVHIAEYVRDERGRYLVPLFRFGPGVDADRPAPKLTLAERQRGYRERKKGEK